MPQAHFLESTSLPFLRTFRKQQSMLLDMLDVHIRMLEDKQKAPVVEPGGPLWTSGVSRKKLVLDYLDEHGPTTIKDLAKALGTTYPALNNLISQGAKSMRHDGSVMLTGERPYKLMRVKGYVQSDADRLQPYLERIMALRTEKDPQDHPIYEAFAKTLLYYTEGVLWPKHQGSRHQANRIWGAMRDHGVIGAIAVIATGREKSGLHALRALGYFEFTAEALVIDHPDLFDAPTRQKAEARIDAENDDDAETD